MRVVERPVAPAADPGRRSPSATWCGRCCRWSIAVLFSFNDGKSRTIWQGFSFRWYWGDPMPSVWHDASLHTALLQTLKLGVITTLITVPLGRAVRDRHRPLARPAAGRARTC